MAEIKFEDETNICFGIISKEEIERHLGVKLTAEQFGLLKGTIENNSDLDECVRSSIDETYFNVLDQFKPKIEQKKLGE